MVKYSKCSSCKFVITTFIGSRTAITEGTFNFKSCLNEFSSIATSTKVSALATPISLKKFKIASRVYPLLLIPFKVESLGSSHPSTSPLATNIFKYLLLVTTPLKFILPNSICLGFGLSKSNSFKTHS